MTQNEQIREIIRAIPAGDVFNRHDIKTSLGDNLDRSQLNAISNVLAEFVKLGMIKKGPHGVYIRNGKRPEEYKTPEKPEQTQVKTTGFYSVVRRFLYAIPAGAKYNRQYIYNSLGVKKGEYNKMSTACKAIKELIDAGKAVKGVNDGTNSTL